MNLFNGLLFPAAGIVLGLILPGIVLLLLLGKQKAWTITDAFFTGWVWMVFCCAVLLPFSESTMALVERVRFVTVVMGGSVFLYLLVRGRVDFALVRLSLKKSFSLGHLLIAMAVLSLCLPLLATHSISYDDTAHLDLISKVIAGEPFQDFRNLVHPKFASMNEEWLAARYPFFGILIACLSFGKAASFIFVYYLLGIALLTAVLCKAFEWGCRRDGSRRTGLLVVSVAALVLATAGPDNYFNYGIYPLQQGKLLLMTAVLYMILGWYRNKGFFDYALGIGLLTSAWLHHLNLLLICGALVPLIMMSILLFSRSGRQRLQAGAILAAAFLLVAPAVIWPQKGVLRVEKPEPVVSYSSESSGSLFVRAAAAAEQPPPATLQNSTAWDVLTIPVRWFRVGKYIEIYLKRAFSPELLLFVCSVLFLPLLGGAVLISTVIISLSVFAVGAQALRVLPGQTAASMFRSGTFWLLRDLGEISTRLTSPGVYWTDPYTAFYLKYLYGTDARVLSDWGQLCLFYPFINAGVESMQRSEGIDSKDLIVLNSRYWGRRIKNLWQRTEDTTYLRLLASSRSWLHEGKSAHLRSFLHHFLSLLDGQLTQQVLVAPAGQVFSRADATPDLLLNSGEIYKDAVIQELADINKGDRLELHLSFSGYGVEFLRQASESPWNAGSYSRYGLKIKLKVGNDRVKVSDPGYESDVFPLTFLGAERNQEGDRVVARFEASRSIEKHYLLIRVIGFGHYRGNGELRKVTVKKLVSRVQE